MSLHAKDIQVHRGGRLILKGVELRCAPGEMVALLGPNGAGKSTLLHAIAGGLPLTAGGVDLDGDATLWPDRARRARRLAVVSQYIGLDFPLPVREVVRLGRMPVSHGRLTTDERIITEALEIVGLADRVDDLFETLSGGQKQRVQLARALAQLWPSPDRPRGFLLLDEPTAHQDPHGVACVLRAAKRWAEAGHGVICVLHDLNLAAAAFDTLALLRAGECWHIGPPTAIMRPEILGSVYGIPLTVLTPEAVSHPIVLHAQGGFDERRE